MFHCCTFSTDNGHNYRTVLWPLGAMSRCVRYKSFLPTDVPFLDNCLHASNTSLVVVWLLMPHSRWMWGQWSMFVCCVFVFTSCGGHVVCTCINCLALHWSV